MRRGLTLLELVMVVSILAVLTAMIVPGMNSQNEETRAAVARKSLQDLRDTLANRYFVDMADLPRPNAADTTRLTAAGNIPQLHFLFFNPRSYVSTATPQYSSLNDYDASTRVGWNGPYVMTTPGRYPTVTERRFPKDPNDTRTWEDCGFTTAYGSVGDQTLMDPWGSPYVVIFIDRAHNSVNVREFYVVSAGPDRDLDLSSWTPNTNGTMNTADDLALLVKTIQL